MTAKQSIPTPHFFSLSLSIWLFWIVLTLQTQTSARMEKMAADKYVFWLSRSQNREPSPWVYQIECGEEMGAQRKRRHFENIRESTEMKKRQVQLTRWWWGVTPCASPMLWKRSFLFIDFVALRAFLRERETLFTLVDKVSCHPLREWNGHRQPNCGVFVSS